MGGEREARAHRVAGDVAGHERGTGRRGDVDVRAARREGLGEAQGQVEELLAAQDEHAAGAGAEDGGEGGGGPGDRAFQRGPPVAVEPVPRALGRAAEREVHGHRLGLPLGPGGAVLPGPEQVGGAVEDVGRCVEPRPSGRDDVDPHAEVVGDPLDGVVAVRAQIGQGGDEVAPAREQAVQRAQGRRGGPAGGQLVVDEDQRPVGGPAPRVVGHEHVLWCVAVLLVEGDQHGRAGDDPPRGVHDVVGVQPVGDEVGEGGGVLGVPEHDRRARRGGRGLRETSPDRVGEVVGRHAHPPWFGGEMLAEHPGHGQVGSPRVAAQGEPDHVLDGHGPLVGSEHETEGVTDDLAGPRGIRHESP